MPIEIHDPVVEQRSAFTAMRRGFGGRCPHCGEGRLFRKFLKPVDTCSVCGEDMSHQRSDDASPYLTMVIVGHIVVPTMLAVQLMTDLPNLTYLAIWLPVTGGLAALLLQPVKGAVIGLQWALRMHGFDGSANPDAPDQSFFESGLATK